MHGVTTIPSPDNYRDRLKMFCELGQRLESQSIYIRNENKFFIDTRTSYPKTDFMLYSGSNSVLNKSWELIRFIKQNKRSNDLVVLHDIIEPYMLFLDKLTSLHKNNRIKHIVSFYFPNTLFYKTKGWERLSEDVSLREKKIYKKLFRKRMLMEKFAARYADGVIGNSEEIINSFCHYYNFPPSKSIAIPTSIDVASYKIVEAAKHHLPHQMHLKEDLLLYVGSIQPRKEIKLLIRAIHQLIFNHQRNISLIICGKLHMGRLEDYNKFIKDLDISESIFFTSHLSASELGIYYCASDCFVFPSNWEGSPRVVKEAMAYNCPVVAADISGTRIIDPNKEYINFFSPNNLGDLVTQILTVLNNKQKMRAKNSRSYLHKKFNPQIVASSTLEFYKKISDL